jgi:drug/metabolite transporter (DMT)-like permease
VLIADAFLSDEHKTPQKVIGVLVGLLGVTVLIGPSSLLDIGSTMTIGTAAQLAIIGAAISYGFASVFGRRFKAMGVTPFNTAIGQVTSASIILLPLVFFIERPDQLPNPSVHVWLSILCLGMLCTALGYILFFRILSSSGATNVVLVTFLVPVSASFLSWLILDEQLHSRYFVGMAFIGLGLAAIDGRLWKKLKAVTQ